MRQVHHRSHAGQARRALPAGRRLAHQLYAPGTVTYDEVVRHFGREILNPDGTINRTKLANLVFPDRIDELNAIVHPEVVKRQNSWMAEVERKDPHGVAVVEAALLIEAGAHKDFDRVIVVTCDLRARSSTTRGATGAPIEERGPRWSAAALRNSPTRRRPATRTTSSTTPGRSKKPSAKSTKSGKSCRPSQAACRTLTIERVDSRKPALFGTLLEVAV